MPVDFVTCQLILTWIHFILLIQDMTHLGNRVDNVDFLLQSRFHDVHSFLFCFHVLLFTITFI